MDRPPVPADVSFLLEDLVPALRDSLRERLLGLYLYGSAVFGDYDPGVSDVDLLAVLPSDLQQAEFEALETVHTGIAEAHTA